MKPKLTMLLRWLRSWLPWTHYRKSPGKKALQVKVHRQWTKYSCTASVAQMVAHYYGIKINHLRAILLTKCRPHGATLPSVARALKRTHGLRHRRLTSRAQIRLALKQGQPVMTNDEINYISSHAILLIGQTPKGFWMADSAIGRIYWRHERSFFAGSDEFIAVTGPD